MIARLAPRGNHPHAELVSGIDLNHTGSWGAEQA